MKVSVVIGVLQNVLWLVWMVRNYFNRVYYWKIGAAVLTLSSAMSLELLDFPPLLKIFDAHSLWHMATIPIVGLYWDFIMDDAQYDLAFQKTK
jgi:hypothetical protein